MNLRDFGPHVPADHLWDAHDVKDFVYTKVYNGMIMTMSCPPMSRLFEVPRQATINDIQKKYPSAVKNVKVSAPSHATKFISLLRITS